VSVDQISTDVEFGAQRPGDDEVSGPANFSPGPVSADVATGNVDLPPQFFPPLGGGGGGTPSPFAPIEAPCPKAALDEFPDVPAGDNVPLDPLALPREGAYRWKKGGLLKQALGGIEQEIEVTGFERRLVKDVELVQEDEEDVGAADQDVRERGATFRYTTVQRDLSTGNVVETGFQVKTNGARAYRDNTSRIGPGEVTTGEPERGVVIKSIQDFRPDGNRGDYRFNPASGLLVLPLQVTEGETWTSTAVDTQTGIQLTLNGDVVKRVRVDACGQEVEGFLVRSEVTGQGPQDSHQFQREWDYAVAPQYGGVLISERISQSGETSDLQLRFTLGQQDPDPLPKGGDL
jgi:hypothetical protein